MPLLSVGCIIIQVIYDHMMSSLKKIILFYRMSHDPHEKWIPTLKKEKWIPTCHTF